MNLVELQKLVQSEGLTEAFSASVPNSDQPCNRWEMPCTDIPDFIDRLPEEIINPETGKKIMISQSFVKDFIKVIEGEVCPRKFWAIKNKEAESVAGDAAHLGNRFQYLAWGLMDYHGNVPEPMLTGIKKMLSAPEQRVRRNAKRANETMERLGYEIKDRHNRMNFKCLDGELDLDCTKDGMELITDGKYSGLVGGKEARRSDYGWPDKEDMHLFPFGHKVQAKHYLLLAELNGMERDGFSFLVFDNRSANEGEYREYVIKVNPAGLNQHKHLILTIIEHLFDWMENDKFQAVPSYKGCKGCPISNTCPHFREFPETIEIEL